MAMVATAQAETCDQVLKKCDEAVKALQADNAARQRVMDTQQAIIDAQKVVIDEQSAWYHNPAYVVPLTILVTLVGVRLAR